MDFSRKAVLLTALLVSCLLIGQILPFCASFSPPGAIAASGTIVYYTHLVTTITELTNVVSKVVPGDIVGIRGGIYQPISPISFQVSGTSDKPITYEACPGEKVVFDGSLATVASLGGSADFPLVRLSGNWNILSNIEVRYSPGAGVLVYGENNVLDHIETHHNKGVGAATIGDRCRFLYCIGHDNVDPQAIVPGGNADGLGASYPSSGSYFLGCLAYGNSDDGIDLYGSTNNTIQKCVAHTNGLLEGDGRGFVLAVGGGNRVSKCIAYNNRAEGFAPGGAPNNIIDHCTAYYNGRKGFFTYGMYVNTFTNNVGDFRWVDLEPTHYSNTWNLGITDPRFISIDPASPDFWSLRDDSPCRGKASDGSDLGALQYGERISNLLGT